MLKIKKETYKQYAQIIFDKIECFSSTKPNHDEKVCQGWRKLQKTGRADLVKLPEFSKTGRAAYSKYLKNW